MAVALASVVTAGAGSNDPVDQRPVPAVVRRLEEHRPGLAGLTFLVKAGGGLYWMIPAVLAGGVVNAWLFLLKVPPD